MSISHFFKIIDLKQSFCGFIKKFISFDLKFDFVFRVTWNSEISLKKFANLFFYDLRRLMSPFLWYENEFNFVNIGKLVSSCAFLIRWSFLHLLKIWESLSLIT